MFTSGIVAKSYARASVLSMLTVFSVTACGGASQTATEAPVPAAANTVPTQPTGNTAEIETTNQTPITNTRPADPEAQAHVVNQELIDGAVSLGCDALSAEFSTTMAELINTSRSEARMCGTASRAPVPAISWNNTLTETARVHANDMAANNFFDHEGSDGTSVADRATRTGYTWRAIGENIAAGQLSMAEVHKGWVDSPGHCRNIMNSLYTEVGAVCVTDANSDFGTYWVVVFGSAKE